MSRVPELIRRVIIEKWSLVQRDAQYAEDTIFNSTAPATVLKLDTVEHAAGKREERDPKIVSI